MGFFEDDEVEDWGKVDTDPFAIPSGVDTDCFVEKAFVKDMGDERVVIITWKDSQSDRRHSEFLKHPRYAKHDDPEKLRLIKGFRRSHIVKVLTSLGVRQNEIESVDIDDLRGIRGTLRLYTDKAGYKKFGRFKVSDAINENDPLLNMESIAAGATEESYF